MSRRIPVLNQILVLETLEPHRRLGKQNDRLRTHRGLPNGVDLGHLGTDPDILLVCLVLYLKSLCCLIGSFIVISFACTEDGGP